MVSKTHERDEKKLDSIVAKAMDLVLKTPSDEVENVVDEGKGGKTLEHANSYVKGGLKIGYNYIEFITGNSRKTFSRHMSISYRNEMVLSAYLEEGNKLFGYTIFKPKATWEKELYMSNRPQRKDVTTKLRGSSNE